MSEQGKSVTIIGLGRIGRVIGQRLVTRGYHVRGYDVQREAMEQAGRQGIEVASSVSQAVAGAKLILLALPPAAVQPVMAELRHLLRPGQVIVSLVGAVPLSYVEELAGEGTPVARIMPNTPSLVGQGMNPVCFGRHIPAAAQAQVNELLDHLGASVTVADDQMNWCTGLTGAAPRYVFAVIEALAEAGMDAGLSPSAATEVAAQVVAGSGLAVLQSGLDLEDLKALTPLQPLDEDAAKPLFRQAVETARRKMDEVWEGLSGTV